jgi:LPS export ABC transporter protein LptC
LAGRSTSRRFTGRAILGAVFLCAVVVALSGCDERERDLPGRSETIPDQEIDGFTLTQTRDGQRVWSLRAANALVYEEADRVEMAELRVDFYDEEGGAKSTLTADEGTLSRRTNDMEVTGNVVVYASDGTVLTTERLTWNERTGKIESDERVTVTKGRDVMKGLGVEADPDLRNIRVRSDFKAYVRTEEGTLVEEE